MGARASQLSWLSSKRSAALIPVGARANTTVWLKNHTVSEVDSAVVPYPATCSHDLLAPGGHSWASFHGGAQGLVVDAEPCLAAIEGQRSLFPEDERQMFRHISLRKGTQDKGLYTLHRLRKLVACSLTVRTVFGRWGIALTVFPQNARRQQPPLRWPQIQWRN